MATKYQGVHKESTGYKMLAALGWKEGEGLVRAQLCAVTRVCLLPTLVRN